MAEVVVTRGTAGGSNLAATAKAAVFHRSQLKTPANNLIDAQPGQRVIIQSRAESKIFGAALLVYILPIVMILLRVFHRVLCWGETRASAFWRALSGCCSVR